MWNVPTGLCDRRVVVKRRTIATDSAGTFTETWNVQFQSVAAGVYQAETREAERYRRDAASAMFAIIVDRDLDIREADRVEYSGRVFDVLGVIRPAEQEAFRKLICEEVR